MNARDLAGGLRSLGGPRRRIGAEWRDDTLALVELCELDEGPRVTEASVSETADADFPELLARACAEGAIEPGPVRLAVGGDGVTVKPLELPPAPRADRLSMLEAESERYFLSPEGRRCHGLFGGEDGEADGEAEGVGRPTWAVAASASALEGLIEAFEAAGFHVELVTASAGVYDRAARLLVGSKASPRPVGPDGAWTDEIQVVRVLGDRRERTRWRDGRLADFVVEEGGSDDRRDPHAVRLTDGSADDGAIALPDGRAATFAGAVGAATVEPAAVGGRLPDLLPGAVRDGRRAWRRRAAGVLCAAGIVLGIAATLLVPRRNALRQARLAEEVARMRERVAPVMRDRAEIEAVRRQVAALRRSRADRPRPLHLLDRVTAALPADAWLTSFAVDRSDRLVLRGFAESGTEVLTALSRVPGLADVGFQQPTRSVRVDGRDLESFALEAGLAPDGAAPAAPVEGTPEGEEP